MKKTWSDFRDQWIKTTSLPEETSLWAIESLNKNERAIYALESLDPKISTSELDQQIKATRKTIKAGLIEKDNSLDDLSLNAANSSKLQVSVPSSLNYLMKVWAAAEGRDLSSVALQCLEIGLRAMKSKGSIPNVAIQRYDDACKKRIALAEVNSIWEEYETLSAKNNTL
ncbi:MULTISPECIES: VHS domain-containing protein [unclassified Prochlorococcus]|uniref:VHS domain-containing protein n=1 Tax=unclassified Prochlorococcus TaxID=2627481 RepID=UPI0005337069|nr:MULTISPECIES: VHS domain-containing protein [unclassified Prochlorococcus]KGG15127.1 putative VHS domain [Prochlorococcus sp. MIT 0602]KGG17399.1 putative VHS domain [Prochlorococcus sp. MIT 0603]